MKFRVISAVTALALVAFAGVALARNPHCAGGIQYVVQALRDKEKSDGHEDYVREMNKAVDQLSQCAGEDPADYEAVGYLGWAYAELDSAGPAGEAFQKAADAATAKGDKKKIDAILANRDHYWSIAYNDGIAAIKDGQGLIDAGAKSDAHPKFMLAVERLTKAKLLRPGNALTLRNLATAYALDGDFSNAETVLRNGLTEAAKDTAVAGLNEALKTVRQNRANGLLEAKEYDQAIAYYEELTKAEPTNPDLFNGLGSAYFSRAGTKADAAKKADFKASADAYAKASTLKPEDADLAFNAALGYQNAGDLAAAESQWRAVIQKRPGDADALSSFGSVLADEKKYDEAQKVLLQAIDTKPDEKIFFRQLGAVYSKAGNNVKSTELLIAYMAMNKGTPVADAAGASKAAKAGSAAANTAGSMGAPDKVLEWDDTSGGGKLQTWLYTKKKVAFTFNTAGALVQKSDWSAPTK